MGHSLALILNAILAGLHHAIDPVPERIFCLSAGILFVGFGFWTRRRVE